MKQRLVYCDYCGNPATLVTGDAIYPGRPSLAGKHFWECTGCDAWVGTHSNSKDHAPLGRLANAELRAAKIRAHAAFDRLWKEKHRRGATKSHARKAGYRWLAEQMGLTGAQCHIGMFSVDQCERVVELCTYITKARLESATGNSQ